MSLKKFRIAVFASGNGTNAEAIIKYFQYHRSTEVALLLTNNPRAYALQRAKDHGIASHSFTREEFTEGASVKAYLKQHGITHIVLAGFLWLIPDYLIRLFPDKIVNIHPALLPKFGGKGMYGAKVHEAVRASGALETGVTIHLVNEQYDEGKILFQGKCEIHTNQTAEEIAACVHQLEHEHYPKVIEQWIGS